MTDDSAAKCRASGARTVERDALCVAAIQLCSRSNVDENMGRCAALVAKAARRGAELVVLPENFAFAGADVDKRRIAEVIGDADAPIQAALARLAAKHGVAIVAGGMPERSEDPERPYNTCLVISAGGSLVAKYRKLHLFDVELADGAVYRESASTSPGAGAVVASVSGVKLGLSVCYDLRFPELYRVLAARGAELLLVPSAFTQTTGKDHWHVLLRARAIENQCWIIGANQWGWRAPDRACYGHSLIADPWGTIVAECSDGPGIACAEVDLGMISTVRASLPAFRHRRPDLGERTCRDDAASSGERALRQD